MIAIRVAIDRASSWSWVTNTNVVPDLAMDPRQLGLHLLAELEIERTERLVEEQDGRSLGEGTRQRDALLLPAGHLGGHPPVESAESDEVEVLAGPTADLRGRQLLHPQPERDVLGDRHVREQGVVLEDGVDVAPVGRQVVDLPALDPQLAR